MPLTSRPVDGATVTLSLTANRTSVAKPLVPATGLTDDQGRFLFRNLSKGRYSVSVTAAGFLDAAYGQRQPGGPSRLIALEEDQTLGSIDVRIWKAASIAGTITDNQDRGVVGISVSLLRADARGGHVRLSESEFGGRYSVQTNDRGDFDFSRLGPGDYVVVVPEHRATAPSSLVAVRNTENRYTTTFHPGASRPEDASIVSLVPGDRRAGIDLRLRRSSTYTVSGTLVGPAGPLAKSQVYLIPTYATGAPLEKTHFAAMAITDPRGGFKFSSVATGQDSRGRGSGHREPHSTHSQRALRWGRGRSQRGRHRGDGCRVEPAARRHGQWPVRAPRVGRDASNVPPPDFPGPGVRADVASRVRKPARCSCRIRWHVSYRGPAAGQVLPSPSESILCARLVLRVGDAGGPEPGGPSSRAERRACDRRRHHAHRWHTELSGSVRDTRGEPDPSASVIVFPAEYQEWIRNQMNPLAARVVAVSQSATYFIDDLPAGAYLVAAMSDEQASLWRQPATIQSLAAGAARIRLQRGGITVQDLRTRR